MSTAVNLPHLSGDDLREAWSVLSIEDRLEGFQLLPKEESEELFFSLPAHDQADILLSLPKDQWRSWVRLLPPDDVADVIQEAPNESKEALLNLLDAQSRKEVNALLAYAEDAAGGLMNPRYARVRPDMTADEAIRYLRRQTREQLESIYYTYVLDEQQRLLGVVSFRELFIANPDRLVRDIMRDEIITVTEDQDQESVSRVFSAHNFVAIPVVDSEQRIKGIVTVDDIVDVVQEEATEDIQKLGGTEALEEPYLQIALNSMIRKRAGWLTILFMGEMLTATAMAFFEHEIAKAVVLALFVPLIISSGGNAGSQACTLVIRAMALGEVRLKDWWRVMKREFITGLTMGSLLGAIGFLRIIVWQHFSPMYGAHYLLVAFTVFISLIGVVLWGSLSGSLLPFVLRRLNFDPASASAPFVATLVDVTGLIIYFSVASIVLSGTLL